MYSGLRSPLPRVPTIHPQVLLRESIRRKGKAVAWSGRTEGGALAVHTEVPQRNCSLGDHLLRGFHRRWESSGPWPQTLARASSMGVLGSLLSSIMPGACPWGRFGLCAFKSPLHETPPVPPPCPPAPTPSPAYQCSPARQPTCPSPSPFNPSPQPHPPRNDLVLQSLEPWVPSREGLPHSHGLVQMQC